MISESKLLHIFFSILFVLFLLERGYFQLRGLRISGETKNFRENKAKMGTMIFLFLVAQIWVIGSFIYIYDPSYFEWTRYPIPPWARWLGMIITVFGMILEFSTQIYLGRNYSTTLHISEEQTLVTSGPYRYVRHPMYTALIMVGIGLGWLSTSWYFLLPFLATGIVIAFRIRREEEAMIEKFGNEYIQYAKETGRFFPKIKR